MFRRKVKKSNISIQKVKIDISKDVIDSIFIECDKDDKHETGGRIIGFYSRKKNVLNVEVCGLIDSGPNTVRTASSLFQDGSYQEDIFRNIEVEYPKIEHLGNWHTHHVNGLNTLSSGDMATYTRIVNHKNHNTDFFYALLVVSKKTKHAKQAVYNYKHFITYRNDPTFYEIPNSQVNLIEKPAIFLGENETLIKTDKEKDSDPILAFKVNTETSQNRIIDKQVIFEMFPSIRPFFSKQLSGIYWKGNLELIDKSSVEIIIMEILEDNEKTSYLIGLTGSNTQRFKTNQKYKERKFDSVRKAIQCFEKDINHEIFKKKELIILE